MAVTSFPVSPERKLRNLETAKVYIALNRYLRWQSSIYFYGVIYLFLSSLLYETSSYK